MADPSPATRTVTYERDRHRCVACGSQRHLTYQHRQAVGMGGSDIRPKLYEGVTACAHHNERFEGDLQQDALRLGWKVRKWVKDCSLVPVYYVSDRSWYRLDRHGERHRISREVAVNMMRDVYGDGYVLQEGEG